MDQSKVIKVESNVIFISFRPREASPDVTSLGEKTPSILKSAADILSRLIADAFGDQSTDQKGGSR